VRFREVSLEHANEAWAEQQSALARLSG
jgi:hypothetical protein